MELKGKNAIVTGAARGIGRGIALKLAEAGANVAMVDLGSPKDPALTYNLAAHGELASAVDEVKSHGVKAAAILADVTRAADCERMAAETVKALGSVDILVNNAGIIAAGPVAEFSEEAWDRVMAVNAKGPFLCSKAAIPHLLRNQEGAIVNIASIAGKTSRGGLVGLLREQVRSDGAHAGAGRGTRPGQHQGERGMPGAAAHRDVDRRAQPVPQQSVGRRQP